MDDRELLENAARAAGVKSAIIYNEDDGAGWYCKIGKGQYWRPFQDDGAAMRLAVNLDIGLRQYIGMVQAEYPWVDDEFNTRKVLCEPVLDDHCAASRRAIVRAAAAIGEKMDAPAVLG